VKFTIPNFLSLLRMGLVPLFIIAVINGDARKALLIFLVAGITDALDGLIARLAHQQSLLGAYLDPIADKLLLTSAYVALSIPQLNHGAPIPLWVTVLVLSRDLLIVVMALIMYLAAGVRRFPPSVLSKVNTVIQVAAVVLVLISALWPALEPVASALVYGVALLTLASGLDYILRASRLSGQAGQPE
jgi:cardiolipin synthase